MLFCDIHLPIPQGARYEFISPRAGDTYLRYRVRSYHEGGKKKHERVTIGRVFKDDLTGMEYFCPNDKYYLKVLNKPLPVSSEVKDKGRTRKAKEHGEAQKPSETNRAFGCMLACHTVVRELGLDAILEESFGSLCNSIIAVASFFALGCPGKMTNIDHFTGQNMCFIRRIIDSSALCKLYKELNAPLRNEFFKRWTDRCREDDEYLCYDVTSVSAYSEQLSDSDWGCNRDKERLRQFNIGMFCTMKKGLPVYYCPYNGSINDFTNFPYVAEHAKSMGIGQTKDITLVMDGGFADPHTISKAVEHGFSLVIGAPCNFGVKIKEQLLGWRLSQQADDKFFVLPDESVSYHQMPVNIEDHSARLMLFRSPNACRREEKNLNSFVNRQDAMLAERKHLSPSAIKDYRHYFDIKIEEDGGFSYKLNNKTYLEESKLCGCFALLTNRDDLSCKETLIIYRRKDMVEKAFATLKNNILEERMHTCTNDGAGGKLFLAFIGLIIRKTFELKLGEYLRKRGMGLDSALDRLRDITCTKKGDLWILDNALTKKQKELVELLKLPVSSLMVK